MDFISDESWNITTSLMILFSFALSIGLIYLLKLLRNRKKANLLDSTNRHYELITSEENNFI